ncbi:MAG: hypothetical protein KJ749_07140, partial [Planctomycetes bacterium]|nr:hypothetical protein [Planctomycetota bacterium]
TDAGEVMLANPGQSTQTYYAQAWALMTFLRDGAGRKHAAAFGRLLADLADGGFGARISAFRLTAPEAAGLTFGEAAFRAYFTGSPEQLEKDYYNHIVRVAGF